MMNPAGRHFDDVTATYTQVKDAGETYRSSRIKNHQQSYYINIYVYNYIYINEKTHIYIYIYMYVYLQYTT